MIFFKSKRKARLVPKKTGKPLSSHDVLVRLRDCWNILSPRRPCGLTEEDLELVGYNMKLAELYSELRALEKDGCGTIGFGGACADQSGDDEDVPRDDEEWYIAGDVYCERGRQ